MAIKTMRPISTISLPSWGVQSSNIVQQLSLLLGLKLHQLFIIQKGARSSFKKHNVSLAHLMRTEAVISRRKSHHRLAVVMNITDITLPIGIVAITKCCQKVANFIICLIDNFLVQTVEDKIKKMYFFCTWDRPKFTN
jgi:hypothetical protein